MSVLKLCFLFTALVLVLAPAYASEVNALRIENITSISSIVNPVTLNLARSVNAAPDWRNFIPPQAFWSPDGSRLLIESRDDMPSKDAVFIAKLSGYGRTMPVRAPENVNPGEATTPQQTVDATSAPASIADSPKTPGFSMIFAGIILMIAMFLIRRWNT